MSHTPSVPSLESKQREQRGEADAAAAAQVPRSLPKLRQIAPGFSFSPVPFFLPSQPLARFGSPEAASGARTASVWISPQWEQLVIDQELAKELSCGICLQLLSKPRQCTNGHLFCHECIIASLEKRPECPTCRCHMSDAENIARFALSPSRCPHRGARRNLIVEKHLRELKLYCRHSFSPDPTNPAKLLHDPVRSIPTHPHIPHSAAGGLPRDPHLRVARGTRELLPVRSCVDTLRR